MPPRKLPPNDVLIGWANEGKTYREIAELVEQTTGHRLSKDAVAVALHRLAATERRQPRYAEWVPWRVAVEHTKQYPAQMLRAYARTGEARNPDAVPAEVWNRLMNWLALLAERNEVVTYSPDTGFEYVKAKAGELIIRRPKPRGGAAAQRQVS